jgi:CHAD domain-containing protein
LRRSGKFLKKPARRPGLEQIYKLRHVEAALDAFGLSDTRPGRRLLRGLARVRKRAGNIRDIDVLTGYALKTQPEGEQDCVVQLLERLGAERDQHAKKLQVSVKSRGPKLRKHLKRTSKKIAKFIQGSEKTPGARTTVIAGLVGKSVELASELGHPGRLDKKNLHEYR